MKTCLQLLLVFVSQHVAQAAVEMFIDPVSIRMSEETSHEITVSFRVNGSVPAESFLKIDSDHRFVAELDREFVIQDLSLNITMSVDAKQIGRSTLRFKFFEHPNAPASINKTVDVAVIRSMPKIQLIFTIFVAILVSINNISMGCVISISTILSVIRKPIAPGIGFACQFLIMPLGSYFIGRVMFPDDANWRLGLFVLGCCPGGTGSNFWTLLFDGDVDLSITMTFVSTIAAMGMMPLWIFTLGRELLQEANVQIPYFNLIISLISLTATLGIGLGIQKYKPGLAAFLRKIMKPLTAVIMTIVIGGGTYISLYIFSHMTWWIVLAGLSCAMSGYVLGGIVAAACGLQRKQIIAVSIETALQNPGIAFVLLQLSLPQPDSDLAAIPIVAQLFMTGIPLWITYIVYFVIKRIWKRIKNKGSDAKNRRSSVDKPAEKEAELQELQPQV